MRRAGGEHRLDAALLRPSPPPATRFPFGSSGRLPTAGEVVEITAAVVGSELVAGVPVGVTVARIRISRRHPDWAFVALRPVADGADPAIGVLCRSPAGWVLGQVGTYRVGRDLAPGAVLAEFGFVERR